MLYKDEFNLKIFKLIKTLNFKSSIKNKKFTSNQNVSSASHTC